MDTRSFSADLRRALDVGVLGALGLELGDLGLELLVAAGELELALVARSRLALGEHLGLEVGRSA
jgi:hypothetical protein